MFDKRHSIFARHGLSLFKRCLYQFGNIIDIVSSFTTPMFLLLALGSAVAGVLPLEVNARFVQAFTLQYVLSALVFGYARRLEDVKHIWFAWIYPSVRVSTDSCCPHTVAAVVAPQHMQ
jgi:hypothetical protein